MIIPEDIRIKLSNKNVSYYSNILGYGSIGDFVTVSSLYITKGSSIKINAKCDYCSCKKEISIKDYNKQTNVGEFKFACSRVCVLIKTKETNLRKYGVENTFQIESVKSIIKETKYNKYGDGNYNNRELAGKTSLVKYGVRYPSSSKKVKDKVKNTNIKKFGYEYPSMNPDILNKMVNTCMYRYGVCNFSKTEDFKKGVREKWYEKMYEKLSDIGVLKSSKNGEYVINCIECKNDFKILTSLRNKRIFKCDVVCTGCNPLKQNVKQNEVFNFISEHISCDLNNRTVLSGMELDIYISDLKVGIEFNGLYWHSEIYKKNTYHLDKTLSCEDNGIKLLHIWEDDWVYKTDIVKSIILNKIGKTPKRIYGRTCEVRLIKDNNIIREFLDTNHLQGFIGSKVKLGLFHNDELVCFMNFGNLRKSLGHSSVEGHYEMLRFCNKINTVVVGGASRLFKYFLKNYKPLCIISYADTSRYDGSLYKMIGFKRISNTVPNYYWVVDKRRCHRFNFRKDKLVSQGYDIHKTEIEIMHERGYFRLWDCGSSKWVFINEDIDLKN